MWPSTGPKTIWHSFLYLTSHVLTCIFLYLSFGAFLTHPNSRSFVTSLLICRASFCVASKGQEELFLARRTATGVSRETVDILAVNHWWMNKKLQEAACIIVYWSCTDDSRSDRIFFIHTLQYQVTGFYSWGESHIVILPLKQVRSLRHFFQFAFGSSLIG